MATGPRTLTAKKPVDDEVTDAAVQALDPAAGAFVVHLRRDHQSAA
jgi:hypothetical protein